MGANGADWTCDAESGEYGMAGRPSASTPRPDPRFLGLPPPPEEDQEKEEEPDPRSSATSAAVTAAEAAALAMASSDAPALGWTGLLFRRRRLTTALPCMSESMGGPM